jgi:hypothetical protein
MEAETAEVTTSEAVDRIVRDLEQVRVGSSDVERRYLAALCVSAITEGDDVTLLGRVTCGGQHSD